MNKQIDETVHSALDLSYNSQ